MEETRTVFVAFQVLAYVEAGRRKDGAWNCEALGGHCVQMSGILEDYDDGGIRYSQVLDLAISASLTQRRGHSNLQGNQKAISHGNQYVITKAITPLINT